MITVIDAETLRQRVWELAATEPDPYVVAAKVREELGPEHFDLIMQVAFPAWVHKVMTYMPPKDLPAPAPDPVLYDNGHGGKTPNPNIASTASWYQKRMRSSVLLVTGYVTLGTCTADDVDYLAEQRKIQALRDLAAAQRFTKLAAAMREHGAATAADLPDEIGEPILRGQAA